ncbi:hypothetical protein GCM10009775_02830 [Microbacterium aoyamense]|uniref:Uncharacterized protein n=1 Tax=Microbacterium aoyamense TaxID=344166 RepID=A0ABN2P788_9MICO|nr:hypothetical protein [Microbacterium aoyamense]
MSRPLPEAWRPLGAVDSTRDRIRALLALDREFTEAESLEWDAVTTRYRASRRAAGKAQR